MYIQRASTAAAALAHCVESENVDPSVAGGHPEGLPSDWRT